MLGSRVGFGRSFRTRHFLSYAAAAIVVATLGYVVSSPDLASADSTPSSSCLDTQPDVATAGKMATTCKRRVESLAERTEFSQTFVNPDGTRTLEETLEPARVRHGSFWVPVDTRLKASAAGVTPRATVLPVSFSGGGDGPLARIGDAGRELGVHWPNRLPVPVVKDDTATYRDVLPGVDLRATAHPLGFSHVLVVRTRQAATSPQLAELRFGLATSGLRVGTDSGGGLAARDSEGRQVFTAPAPLMWDSSTATAERSGAPDPTENQGIKPVEPGPATSAGRSAGSRSRKGAPGVSVPDGARQAVMPVRVDGDELRIFPDHKLLADPAAKLPIYIDPAWTGKVSGNAWTSVWSKHKSSSFWQNSTAQPDGKTFGSAGSGRTEDCPGCGDHIVRSLFRMNTATVRGKQILSAVFSVQQLHAWTCNPKSNAKLWMTGAISSGTTWNKQPTWYSSPAPVQTPANRKLGSAHGCQGAGPIEFNATSMVAFAAARNWTTMTVGLRAVSESAKNQWKRFNHTSPKLAITYNTPPSAPTDRYSDTEDCATGSARPYVLTLSPKLVAKQSDPDNDQGLTTSFYWWQQGGSRNETNRLSASAGNKTSVSKAIPTGKLTDGGTYVWQARTADSRTSGAWSATCEFTVDVTAPPAPAGVSSRDYPASTPTTAPGGGVGIEGEFKLTPPSNEVPDMVGYTWTLDSGVLPSSGNPEPTSGAEPITIHYTPKRDGPHTLRVWTVDRAGWYSAQPYTYIFDVRAGSGPAAEWRFDEPSGAATDTTGHDNTAVLGGGATRVPGRSGVNSALSLNGTTAMATVTGPIKAPHPNTNIPTEMRTDSSLSVSAWVRLPKTLTGSGQRTIIAANGSRVSAYALSYSMADQKWRFTMAGADADNPALFSVLSDGIAVKDRWTHLAATYDVATKKMVLYVNGVAQSSSPTVTGGFNAVASVTVGMRRWNGVNDGYFNGLVDDVRVSSYPITGTALAPLAAPLPPTIAISADSVLVGAPAKAVIGGGDENVVRYRYSIGSDRLDQTEKPSVAGETVTIPLPTTTIGVVKIFAVAVDGNDRQSVEPSRGQLLVKAKVSISGIVTDDEGNRLPNAVVTLEPGGLSTQADATGRYGMSGFDAGLYNVRATYGGHCGLAAVVSNYKIDSAMTLNIMLTPLSDELGHICVERESAFVPAEQSILPLAGDDAVSQLDIPFAFPFYGASYRSAWVDTNGVLSFDDPGGSHPYPGGSLPTQADPNALVAPFWDDLVVDSAASVRTAITGSGHDQRMLIEWRNVHRKASTAQRLSFEVTLAADGTVTTNYSGLDNDAERGAQAAVGIEAPAGEDGFTYSAGAPVLANNRAVVFDHPGSGSPIDVYGLSGTLLDASGVPVVGATVTLDPSGLSVTTGAGGAWRFDRLVADSYAVSVSVGGRCSRVARDQVELASDTTLNLRLGPDYGAMGYACAVGSSAYAPASAVLGLTGDDVATRVTLPFAFTFHGVSYPSVWVNTNGLLSFGEDPDAASTYANPTMPTAKVPNALVAPFWEDLNVDASASVRTQASGTAPNRSWVVEWHNMLLQGTTDRVSFEAVLHEDGRIAFQYGAMSTPPQQGAGATVGLESAAGTVAALYSFQEAALQADTSITYSPAAAGTVSGTVTTAVTGEPVAGATVRLEPKGLTATTGADGGYQFTDLPVGEYTVATSTGDQRCAGQYAKAPVDMAGGIADVDLSLMTAGDEGGYQCATGAQEFISGDSVEDWSGDETVWQKNPPFPIKLYGDTYTSAWVSANGLVSFKDPAYFGWIGSWPGPLPSAAAEGVPNAAVYVAWDDWVIDEPAAIATRVAGTAPNRQWVVEWRNVTLFEDRSVRATFEVIFTESGEITFRYKDIDPTSALERGSGALVGIENASGTIGFQYSLREPVLASGQGVRFTPTPPGNGTLTGTVTCQGEPVSGTTVTVGERSVTSGTDGTYMATEVPAGTHAVLATPPGGVCAGTMVAQVTVGTNTSREVDFPAVATPAGGGYRLAEQQMTFTPADSALALAGDDAYTQVAVPFPVTLYGQTYSTGWVDTNGLVAFVDPGEPSPDAWPIPSPDSPEEPNAAVYPFWHDWVVDGKASVRTATIGSAPHRQWVVEWRNVYSYEDPNTRVSFEVVFDEGGGFSFVYTDVEGTFLESGGGATIGIENADGTTALQYTYRQPVLRPGYALRFTEPSA